MNNNTSNLKPPDLPALGESLRAADEGKNTSATSTATERNSPGCYPDETRSGTLRRCHTTQTTLSPMSATILR
jgi:hypothetical protein